MGHRLLTQSTRDPPGLSSSAWPAQSVARPRAPQKWKTLVFGTDFALSLSRTPRAAPFQQSRLETVLPDDRIARPTSAAPFVHIGTLQLRR